MAKDQGLAVPTKENRQKVVFPDFSVHGKNGLENVFLVHGKNGLGWDQMGPGVFVFPTNPDLADILGRTDLNFENLYFFHFLDPKFPDAAANGRTLRSQLDPSPNAPRDQIHRKARVAFAAKLKSEDTFQGHSKGPCDVLDA